MITFESTLHQFANHGEKTGWTYIAIPADIALSLKPNNKKSFRVKGKIDNFPIAGVALLPMGEGTFIIAINGDMRQGIKKTKGAVVKVTLEIHNDYVVEVPPDLLDGFDYEEPEALAFFNGLPRGHRDYFIKWINSAKTEQTRAVRIANTINAASRRLGYSEMMRDLKARK